MVAEMEVATNGPLLVEADGLLDKAMRNYLKGWSWHLIKRCNIRDYNKNSKVICKLRKQKSKLSFMV